MLEKHKVITTIAVHDIENAVIFYGEILGLKLIERNFAGIVFGAAGGRIGIHQSNTAGTGQATCAWWTVDDVEGMVKNLKKRGVKFEKNYDLPHTTRSGDIYRLSRTAKAAWFKDPDGNILGFGNF